MKRYKYLLAGLLCMTMLGCGSGSSSSSYDSVNTVGGAQLSEGLSYGIGGSKNVTNSYDSYKDSDYSSEENYAGDDKEATSFPSEETVNKSAKIIYTSDVTVESLSYDESLGSLRELIKQNKGFVQSENEYDNGGTWYSKDYRSYRTLNITIRIPTENFDAFLNGLEGSGQITSKSKEAENVTREHADISAQIQSLNIQEERIMDMLDKAETIDEMITVERRLTEVQTQLNRYKTQLSVMDMDIDYSTIRVTLREVRRYTDVDRPYFERLKDSFKAGFDGFRTFIGNLILFLAEKWIFLLFWAGVIYGVVKLSQKRKQKTKFNFRRKNSEDQTPKN